MDKPLAKRWIFLMALWVTVIVATPILHDPTDAVDAAASALEMNQGDFHSTNSSPQDEDLVAEDPAIIQCPSDTSEHNVIDNSVQKRRIFPRQNGACPKTPSRTPVQLRGPTLSIHRSSEGKIQKRPCPTRGPSQHVSCGYAMVGESVVELDFALNCVPGPATSIAKRDEFPEATNVAQFCCEDFYNRPPLYISQSCHQIVAANLPLPLWDLEYFTNWIQEYRKAIDARVHRELGE